MVDTQGLVLKVLVSAAQVHDTVGARAVLTSCRQQFPQLNIIWADQSYRGPLEEWVHEQHQCHLEIVYRSNRKQRHEQVWTIARQRAQQGASVPEM